MRLRPIMRPTPCWSGARLASSSSRRAGGLARAQVSLIAPYAQGQGSPRHRHQHRRSAGMSAWASFEPTRIRIRCRRVQAEWHRLHLGDQACPTDLRLLEGWGAFPRQASSRRPGSVIHSTRSLHAAAPGHLHPYPASPRAIGIRAARASEPSPAARGRRPKAGLTTNAWFWWAYALGRWPGHQRGQRRWRRAGAQVRQALERCIALEPLRICMRTSHWSTFHAEGD